MMNEDKIKQAADNYVDKGRQSANEVDAFTHGALWAIEEFKSSLWHDESESPQEGEQCLVDMEFLYEDAPEDNYRTFITSTYGEWGWTEDYMPSEATHFKLHRWCYIKDLLPEGGKK